MLRKCFKKLKRTVASCKRLSLGFVDYLFTGIFFFLTGVEILMFAHSGNMFSINDNTAKWQ